MENIQNKVDAYYSSEDVVKTIYSKIDSSFTPKSIADFSAGRGNLLNYANKKWPKSKIIATDINPSTVSYLKRHHKKWEISLCDFFSSQSRNRCSALKNRKNKISLILLNPPFSCRGGKKHIVNLGDNHLSCSTGLAFMINAINYLEPDGRLICLLPKGSLYSNKDHETWLYLLKKYNCRVINFFGDNSFNQVTANIVAIELKNSPVRNKRSPVLSTIEPKRRELYISKIIRGGQSLHKAKYFRGKQKAKFIHTVDIKNNKIISNKWLKKNTKPELRGTHIFLPRVGNPDLRKVVLYKNRNPIIISDCLFALSCSSDYVAKVIYNRIINHWGVIEAAYGGSCAPYMTINKLRQALEFLDVKERNFLETSNYGIKNINLRLTG